MSAIMEYIQSHFYQLLLWGVPSIVVIVAAVWGIMRIRSKPKTEKYDKFVKGQGLEYEEAVTRVEELTAKFRDKVGILIHIIHDLDSNKEGADLVSAPGSISYQEAFEKIGAIRSAEKGTKIHIIVHTLGGYALPSFMIADAIRKHDGDVQVYVPYVAMSGGTIIALAAGEVCMGKVARLGPVDTVYGGYTYSTLKALSIEKGGNDKLSDEVLLTVIEADKYEAYSKNEVKSFTHENHMPKDGAHIAEELSAGKMSHNQGLDFSQVKAMGMNVKDSCPELVYQITDAQIRVIKSRPTKAAILAKAKDQSFKRRNERSKRERSS
ncbi:MAG: hypothetical protein COA85_10545 [Robiginitomaculum sp.]|nr:MAG: hypothetical protein COA85_10545 [Robiginitomaculum sp.]